MHIENLLINGVASTGNSMPVKKSNTTNNSLSIFSDEKFFEAMQNSSQTSLPKSPEEFQKTLGLSGSTILTASTVNKKDGSQTDIYQFDNGTGEVRVTTSKDKKKQSYSYYRYDYSKDEPVGIFNIRETTQENGEKSYMTDFIDNLRGFATN